MRVGTLEIQLLAGMARLQKDMNDAQRIVGGAMGNVERSVASAKRAMQTLGVGLPIALITDQVRRMTDQYTKLDAQVRLATKSQAAYAQGMADIRRISTIAQADISATSMLYTRLINTMEGTGVARSKLATVTETISFGLKAYGATTQEAASAALQLSQAMGANRLGGEEFRAVMEGMPNVMKVLADSMGVPLGQLRQLSIDGKITADEMIKAFGNPAVAAQFKTLAEATQTVTGAWQVARNELMLLVGEFSKSSGLTSGAIAGFNAFGAVFRFMADNIDLLTRALGAYAAVLVGKFVVGVAQARLAQIALNAAHAEALVMNAAMARAETQRLALNIEVIASERAKAATELQSAQATMAATAAVGAHSAALRYNAIATAQAAAATANLAALGRAQAASAAQQTAATAALAAAEKAHAASSVTIMSRIKGLAGKAGWIGMALFGAWTVYDFLNGMQQVADGADKLKNKFEGLSLAEVQMARQRELIRQIGMRGMFQDDAAIQNSQDMIRAYDQQIAKMVDLQSAETAAQQVKIAGSTLTHDQQVLEKEMIALAEQFNDKKLTEAAYLERVNEALYGKAAVQESAIAKQLASLREELDLYGKGIAEVAAYNAEKAGGTPDQVARVKAMAEELDWQKTLDNYERKVLNDKADREQKVIDDIAKAEETARKEQRRAHEDMWKSIEGVAHDTWTRVWTEGRDAFQNIGKTIKSAILDLLYQMTVKKWIIGVSTSGTGTAAGATSSGGIGSWMQAGQSMWSAFSGGMTGTMGSLAVSAGEMLGSTALTSFGTGMSSVLGAGVAGPTMAGAGGMAGLGASIGAAMPYLAAALVAYNLLSGDKGKPTQNLGHAGMTFDPTGAVTSSQTMYGGSSSGTDTQVRAMNAAYLQAAMSLGIGAVASEFRFGANTGGRGNNYTPQFSLSGGAGSGSFTQAEIAQSDAAIQLAASKAVFAALQGSDLPQYLRSVFNGLTASTATQQQIEDTLAFAHSLKTMRESLLEARTPLEILRANVDAGTAAFRTSAATFKNDFVAAIDAGINPTILAQWQQLGAAIDQLAQVDASAAAAKIQAITQAATSREQSAIAALRAAVDAEKAALTAAYNKQLDAMKLRVDNITSSISKLSELSGALRASVSAMGVGSSRANAQAQISSVLAIARAGGVLPNAADIQDSLNIIAQPSEMLFGSFTDYMRDFIRTSNDIQALADISDSQLTEQESLLVLAQNQIDLLTANHNASLLRLDGILSAALGTTAAVLSVAAALSAVKAASATTTAITSTTPISTTDGGSVAAKINEMYKSVLGREADPTGLIGWGTAAMGGMSLADIYANIVHSPEAIAKGVPQFAVGVNEVPADTLAMVHKGEEIKPKAFVQADREAQAESNRLLSEMRTELAEIKRTNLRMWQTTEQWDIEGTPEVRTV